MNPEPREPIGPAPKRTLRLGRAVRFVWESAKGWTLLNAGLLVIQGLLPLLPLYLMKLMVDAVTAGISAADKWAAFQHVMGIGAAMGAVTLLGLALRLLAGWVGEWQSYLVMDHMNDVLLAKSVEVDLEYYESSRYYDTLHRAQREAPTRPLRIVNGLAQIVQNGISLVAISALLLVFHWIIAVILFAAVLLGTAVQWRYSRKLFRWQKEQSSAERQASYLNLLLTHSSYAKEIRLFDLGALFMDRFREIRRKLREGRIALARRQTIAQAGAQTAGLAVLYSLYAYLAYQALGGKITLGDLAMYAQAFQRVQGAFQGILGSLVGLAEDNLFLANLYEFLDLKRTVAEPDPAQPVPRPMRRGLVLDHVSFRYPGSARTVLEDVSLAIRPGETIALVGANGSGKTTLVKLLCRLYDPTGGTIALDGVDLRQFETKALRREIAILFQDYARYHLSAAENVWMGNAARPPDRERIVAAARRSGADEVIRRLPHGYDTMLGKWFADGEELSVGEWQKVALARAFMRDAQILVLDEPTSSMDAKAEYDVFQRFRQLVAGRTAVLISHRFSTVRMADRIFVLEQGRISEGGTHDELVRAGGTYARLFEMQAQHYR